MGSFDVRGVIWALESRKKVPKTPKKSPFKIEKKFFLKIFGGANFPKFNRFWG